MGRAPRAGRRPRRVRGLRLRWPNATFTKLWASPKRRRTRNSKPRSASRRWLAIPTATPATKRPRRVSRISTKLISICRTRKSARLTTVSAMPRSSRAAQAWAKGSALRCRTSSTICSATSWAGAAAAGATRRAKSAARICATISKFRWRTPFAARTPRSSCKPQPPATLARARAQSPVPAPSPAAPAPATAACARNRDFSRSSAPVRLARGADRSSKTLATNARAPGGSRASGRCRSTCPPASRTARVSA